MISASPSKTAGQTRRKRRKPVYIPKNKRLPLPNDERRKKNDAWPFKKKFVCPRNGREKKKSCGRKSNLPLRNKKNRNFGNNGKPKKRRKQSS